jgi:competence protein ComEC
MNVKIFTQTYPSSICLFLIIIISILANHLWSTYPDNHVYHYIGDITWEISGVITDHPKYKSNKTQIIIKVDHLKKGNTSHAAQGNIKLSVWGNVLYLKKGMRIRFHSAIKAFKNFQNPGGFDYKHYMNYQKKIHAYAYTQKNHIDIINNSYCLNLIEYYTDAMTQKISKLIQTCASEKSSGFLHAIILGNQDNLDDSVRTIFVSTGTAHILAISGLHVGMIAISAFILFQWLFRRSEQLCLYGWSDICAVIPAFFLMTLYFCISGMSASSQRAFIMISVFLIAQIVNREQQPINTLCFAGLLILLWDIRSLYSISFQMSFIAVLFIILGFSKLKQSKSFFRFHYLIRYALNILLCSLFAILATSPLALHYFYQTSFMGIIVNFMSLPFVGFFILPISLISVLTSFICQSFSEKLMFISSYASDIFIDCLNWLSQYSDPFVVYGHLNSLEIFCWYGMVLLFFSKYRSYYKYSWAIVLLISTFDGLYWTHYRFFQDNVRISILDVGTGNAAVIELPGGRCMMIDGGGVSGSFDIGKHVIAPYLWQHKIKTVDTLILTHPDRDHLQGLLYVAQYFNVKNIWSNGRTKKSWLYKQWLAIIDDKNIHHEHLHVNIEKKSENVVFRFFNPPDCSKPFFYDANNQSLVIQLIYKNIRFLFPGDIELEAENLIVQNYCDQLKSDLLLCPHHGSRTSSSQAFINCVQPTWVFVSVGEHYSHKLPNPRVLDRYDHFGCKLKRTDREGTIIVSLNDNNTVQVHVPQK